MLKHLRRWHFDLLFFLGLALFATAYWYAKPRPIWQKFYPTYAPVSYDEHQFLNFSADSQRFYSSLQSRKAGNTFQSRIITWNTLTGDIEGEIDIKLPELPSVDEQTPQTLRPPLPTIISGTDPAVITVIQPSRNGPRFSFFSLDGSQLGQSVQLELGQTATYLKDNDSQGLALVTSPVKRDKKPYLLDITKGKTIATLEPPTGFVYLYSFPVHGNQYAVVFWCPETYRFGYREPLKATMDVIDLRTHQSVVRFEIPENIKYHELVLLSQNEWVVCSDVLQGGVRASRLDYYWYDPEAKTLKINAQHPLHGLRLEFNSRMMAMPPYLVTSFQDNQQPQNESVLMGKIKEWLAKIGIQRNEMNCLNYRVADLATGQPLRQVSGLLYTLRAISPDARHIVGDHTGPNHEPGFELYVIPHHLWEKSLSWMQWLSWLLVIPWPLRYFINSSRLEEPGGDHAVKLR